MKIAPILAIGCALTLGTLLPACASKKTITTRQVRSDVATWTGAHRDDVVEVFGEPHRVTSDGEGGEVLEYTEFSVGRPNSYPEKPAPIGPEEYLSVGAPPIPPVVRSGETEKTLMKFHVNAEGVVYRYWFDKALWKKGIPRPPSKREGP